MTRAWSSICAACGVRQGLIFLMLCNANLQDRAVFAMWSLKVSWSSNYTKISDWTWRDNSSNLLGSSPGTALYLRCWVLRFNETCRQSRCQGTFVRETKETDNKIAESATTDAHIDKRLWARGYETAQLWFKRVQKDSLSHNLTGKNRADTEHGWSFLEHICRLPAFAHNFKWSILWKAKCLIVRIH